MSVVREAQYLRSAQALASTFTVHQAVSIAVAGGEGDCWRRYLPDALKPAYGQDETTKGERAIVRTFELRHRI